MKPILQIIPEKNAPQCLLHQCGELTSVPCIVNLEAECQIIEYGERKRVWPLEHHADFLAQSDEVNGRRVNVLLLHDHTACHLDSFNEVVHSVENPDKRRFS